ncbi:unnamed protein product [Penicillium nalgiovense]|uniref:Uncharacterized protein n=1 Tax=Penicillium nalgiovense TaxID=60175 RepID=A0A9W4N6K9_PENNA|nr:unnamed protein product [Penicillium nalgiovense]CAG7957207.1 unnamed protein product [Penicillium nalgiovense]CAG7958601.1 unnamed protein product [Penicillium nalgiovense]CAG7993848.1 unnamed protein product [Penicillium nalgiovense]CAG7996736.1 unnamed protein product [Penicillium nalgiovense]
MSTAAATVWPSQFANTSLFYALHSWSSSDESEPHGWSISRYRYVLYVMVGAFVRIPGVLWQGLLVYAFVTGKVPLTCFIPDLS